MTRAWPVSNLDPDAPTDVNARKVLAVRIAELYSYEPAVTEPAWSHELHDMRIAAKRLRYTLELFAPQFGEHGKRQTDRIKQVQEALGNLHDRDVEIEMVGAELAPPWPTRPNAFVLNWPGPRYRTCQPSRHQHCALRRTMCDVD